jgi:hypothetical protein
MSDNGGKTTKGKDIYVYDTEGHYMWHSSFTEALEDIRKLISRKE